MLWEMAKGESLTQSAYETVRSDILMCRIEPGSRVSIVDVAARLEVSAGAVREALSRLTAEGLVNASPQRGFRAAEVSADDLRDLTSVRIEVEQSCVRRSVKHGDLAWESRLVAAHHELTRRPYREPSSPDRLSDAWSGAHSAFHEAIVGACDSRYLLDIRRQLYARAERYRQLSVPYESSHRDTAREHRAMFEAALSRNGDRAALLIAKHLTTTATLLLGALFTQPRVAASG